MENIRGRLFDDYPDDDPADILPLPKYDRIALELWLSEQYVPDGQPFTSARPRQETRSPTVIYFAPPERNRAAPKSFADPERLTARIVAQLGLHRRGRPARVRKRAARRRVRDPWRKRR